MFLRLNKVRAQEALFVKKTCGVIHKNLLALYTVWRPCALGEAAAKPVRALAPAAAKNLPVARTRTDKF